MDPRLSSLLRPLRAFPLSLRLPTTPPTALYLSKGLDSPSLLVFHRLTVMLVDSVLVYGIHWLGKKLGSRERNLMWVLVVWSPGLLIVDHMHLQYNEVLFGLLLLSLSWLEDGKDLMVCFCRVAGLRRWEGLTGANLKGSRHRDPPHRSRSFREHMRGGRMFSAICFDFDV